MNTWEERQQALLDALSSRIVVLDGAMGTMLQRANLTAADFGGSALEGCNENLVRTRPDVVLDVAPRLLCRRRRHGGDEFLRRHAARSR